MALYLKIVFNLFFFTLLCSKTNFARQVDASRVDILNLSKLKCNAPSVAPCKCTFGKTLRLLLSQVSVRCWVPTFRRCTLDLQLRSEGCRLRWNACRPGISIQSDSNCLFDSTQGCNLRGFCRCFSTRFRNQSSGSFRSRPAQSRCWSSSCRRICSILCSGRSFDLHDTYHLRTRKLPAFQPRRLNGNNKISISKHRNQLSGKSELKNPTWMALFGVFRFRFSTSSLTANSVRRTTLIRVVLFDAVLLFFVVTSQGTWAVNVCALNPTMIANAFCAAAGRWVCPFTLIQHFVAVEALRAVFTLQLGALETVGRNDWETDFHGHGVRAMARIRMFLFYRGIN